MSDPRGTGSPADPAPEQASRATSGVYDAGEKPSRSTVGVYDAPERRPGLNPTLIIALVVVIVLIAGVVIWFT